MNSCGCLGELGILQVNAADPEAFICKRLARWLPMNPPAPQTKTRFTDLLLDTARPQHL